MIKAGQCGLFSIYLGRNLHFMDYVDWIMRESKIRIKILLDSPVIRKTGFYRICRDCGEICLCHEKACPNCNKKNISQEKFDKEELF